MTDFSTRPIALETLDRAGAALASESARFAARGWMPGTAGNLSVLLRADPLRLAVTASGLDKGELTHGDIVVVDAHGHRVHGEAGSQGNPSAEAGLHARIARVAGAGAIIHVHALAAVTAAHVWPGGVALHDLEMLKGLGHSAHGEQIVIPVVPNGQDMDLVGDAFEAVYRPATNDVRDVPALLVADHGIYAWGKDLREARWHLEITEALLQIALARR